MAALLARPPHAPWLVCSRLRAPIPISIATPAAAAKPSAPRWLTTGAGELDRLLDRVSQPPDEEQTQPVVHVVHSVGRNPYANLAIEHRLFERAHPQSRLLLLYRNAPCVVIGRNQNPWAEVNLNQLSARARPTGVPQAPPLGDVQLVRRRSGGGAVYHDAGNANWSVHIPAAGFDRDQHALMVARALQTLGVTSARVNERHDIVVGSGSADDVGEYKISGSAYKLTNRRALHHGTCLLGADLAAVSGLLRAPPAAPYLKARGVASVRSPVRNVTLVGEDVEGAHDPHDHFGSTVAAEFERMYGPAASKTVINVDAMAADESGGRGGFAFDPKLASGYNELMTADWLFGQTPQFTFSTQATEDDRRERPLRPLDVPPHFDLAFTARHGRLQEVTITGLPYASGSDAAVSNSSDIEKATATALEDRLLYGIRDWRAVLGEASPVPLDTARASATGRWLNELFGVQCY
ncbi:hypothetical protein HMPREF1624_07951 [Sporothrix schenckii ATCC 58251]|uniref:Putative lipoate-protein ligase A n=1 Tax=Sporothrix schenckii (strain ATCC 58251 / de Perez 2211183) TaxID=1391915 RepID=U7PMC5_SPOS1|nr:hypothetical protein HMPREF1624_07951 [Sporothrix schenckii ATCC 58251]